MTAERLSLTEVEDIFLLGNRKPCSLRPLFQERWPQ
jgi:hypothetical protein